MSSKDSARRTDIMIHFAGVDISQRIRPYLLSMTYTDNEEDRTDDLQISLDDRDRTWLRWLNEKGNAKGVKVQAVIVQKNWDGTGRDRKLDCGTFELDSIDFSNPPGKVNIKATSIPYASTMRMQIKTKAWENVKLSAIANDLAAQNGMDCMYESSYDPLYTRKEQVKKTDLVFLQELCKGAGISLKVTSNTIVLFDAAEYEKKPPVFTISFGNSDITRASFGTSYTDTAYSSCHVVYEDPQTGQKIEGEYQQPGEGSGQVLEVNERVTSAAEAKQLAQKRLRQKNKGEFKAEFTLVGNVALVAGVTVQVEGYGLFDGKYIIETATHNPTGGYSVGLKLRRVLEGY